MRRHRQVTFSQASADRQKQRTTNPWLQRGLFGVFASHQTQDSEAAASPKRITPKGPCTSLLYTWVPKSLYRKYFKAQVYNNQVHGPLGNCSAHNTRVSCHVQHAACGKATGAPFGAPCAATPTSPSIATTFCTSKHQKEAAGSGAAFRPAKNSTNPRSFEGTSTVVRRL